VSRPGHIPHRTCIGCRKAFPKRELVRIVRTPGGELKVDETGKLPGRGAYLCCNARCWEHTLERRGLERALRTTISEEENLALRHFLQKLTLARHRP